MYKYLPVTKIEGTDEIWDGQPIARYTDGDLNENFACWADQVIDNQIRCIETGRGGDCGVYIKFCSTKRKKGGLIVSANLWDSLQAYNE